MLLSGHRFGNLFCLLFVRLLSAISQAVKILKTLSLIFFYKPQNGGTLESISV